VCAHSRVRVRVCTYVCVCVRARVCVYTYALYAYTHTLFLQHALTHCNTLQRMHDILTQSSCNIHSYNQGVCEYMHIRTHASCNTLLYTPTHSSCNTYSHIATHCNVCMIYSHNLPATYTHILPATRSCIYPPTLSATFTLIYTHTLFLQLFLSLSLSRAR